VALIGSRGTCLRLGLEHKGSFGLCLAFGFWRGCTTCGVQEREANNGQYGEGSSGVHAAGQKHAHIYKQSNLTGATSGQGANVDVYKKLNLVTQHKRVQEPLSRCLLKAGTVDR